MIRRPPMSTRTDTLFPYTTLFRSERIVGWVFGELVPPWHLFQADRLRVIGRRAGAQQGRVVVVAGARDGHAAAAPGHLPGEVRKHDLAEGAIAEPVVADPAVHHRAVRRDQDRKSTRLNSSH